MVIHGDELSQATFVYTNTAKMHQQRSRTRMTKLEYRHFDFIENALEIQT